MNRKFFYPVMIVLFLAVTGFIWKQYNKHIDANAFFELKNRQGDLAKNEEWPGIKESANKLFRQVKENPDDDRASIALAALFIREGRITGNHTYYDKAAMQQVNKVLAKDSDHFIALFYKSLIQLSQHHFSEGLITAEKARKINPHNSDIYGLLVDANVELGNYPLAVTYADSMISLRPDLKAYARISYLREIHGDYNGAIEAMKLAVTAGEPGDETTEWARVQLGHLFESVGDIYNAELQYRQSISYRPYYAYSLAGMARIELANKNFESAIEYYRRAELLSTDFSVREGLADAYRLNGREDMAEDLFSKIINEMEKSSRAAMQDENMGHYSDGELAKAYLKIANINKALQYAIAEYNRRPGNIEVNETLATIYYRKGDLKMAAKYMSNALKTQSQNPALLCQAGLIHAKTGNKEKALYYLHAALRNNPGIDENLKNESMLALKSL